MAANKVPALNCASKQFTPAAATTCSMEYDCLSQWQSSYEKFIELRIDVTTMFLEGKPQMYLKLYGMA